MSLFASVGASHSYPIQAAQVAASAQAAQSSQGRHLDNDGDYDNGAPDAAAPSAPSSGNAPGKLNVLA